MPCVSRAVLILWVRTGGDSIQAAFVSMSRVIRTADPERHGIELSLLRHVSPIEWDNIVLYGEYVLNRRLVRRTRSRP